MLLQQHGQREDVCAYSFGYFKENELNTYPLINKC